MDKKHFKSFRQQLLQRIKKQSLNNEFDLILLNPSTFFLLFGEGHHCVIYGLHAWACSYAPRDQIYFINTSKSNVPFDASSFTDEWAICPREEEGSQ